MDRYVITDQCTRYTRISKAKARKLWGTVDIALCPVKLRPGYPWAPHITVTAEQVHTESLFINGRLKFDDAVSEFEHYNCTCNETGYYTAFYLVEPREGN